MEETHTRTTLAIMSHLRVYLPAARYYANKSKYPSRILANDFAAEAMHLKVAEKGVFG